jgi:hypothetical protein
VCVDVVLHTDPGEKSQAKGKVEEAFVGDGEDYEHRREGQEDDEEAMEVMVARLEAMEERDSK